MMNPDWKGEKPFFLAIETGEGLGQKLTLIDLDEPGWSTTHADLMRGESVWHLVSKGGNQAIAFSMRVNAGEQPYYVGRHVGIGLVESGTTREITAYGIGKKRLDGAVDRVWILPNAQVVVGDDIEWFGTRLLRQMPAPGAIVDGPAPEEPHMARSTNPDLEEPENPAQLGDRSDKPLPPDDPEEAANLAGYTGPDGSKSPGYLQHPPAQDGSGLPMDADDAGRTDQDPGQNSAGNSQPQESTSL